MPTQSRRLLRLAEQVSVKARELGRAEEDGDFVDAALAEEAHDKAWMDFRDAVDELKHK